MTQKVSESLPTRFFFDELSDREKALVCYKIGNMAAGPLEIAQALKLDRRTVTRYLKRPQITYAINEFNKTALQIILENQIKIVHVVLKHLDSDDKAISLRAALGLLDKFVPDRKEFETLFTQIVIMDPSKNDIVPPE